MIVSPPSAGIGKHVCGWGPHAPRGPAGAEASDGLWLERARNGREPRGGGRGTVAGVDELYRAPRSDDRAGGPAEPTGARLGWATCHSAVCLLGRRARPTAMVKVRTHYPVAIYGLTLLCALGVASVALGIVDGWILIAAGVTAISVSLVRLHLILDRRRAAVGLRLRPLDGPSVPRRRR